MKNRKRFRILRIMLLAIIVICLVPIGQTYSLSLQHKKQQKELKNNLKTKKPLTESQNTPTEEPDMAADLTSLYQQNNDFIGWLSIDGTNIDYPVMQSKDDEYYLNHNFYKEEDRYGSLFVKEAADIKTPGTNVIIYGHNMKDGSMFGDLDCYKEQSYYEKHTLISFETLSENRTYEIMAVFPSQVSDEKGSFQYYQFYQADTKEEFLQFYENVKAYSLYDTDITAEFGDTFLTLSTCDNHTENGRFVVVAKRIEHIEP